MEVAIVAILRVSSGLLFGIMSMTTASCKRVRAPASHRATAALCSNNGIVSEHALNIKTLKVMELCKLKVSAMFRPLLYHASYYE